MSTGNEGMDDDTLAYMRALAHAVDAPELRQCVDEIDRLRAAYRDAQVSAATVRRQERERCADAARAVGHGVRAYDYVSELCAEAIRKLPDDPGNPWAKPSG